MQLCDRCYHRGDYRPGAVKIQIDVEHADLCASCADEVRQMIFSPENDSKRVKKTKP
jgi:superfamily II helicase